MLNDHGFRWGSGYAHRRTAESLAKAGHDVVPLALRAEPGYAGEPSRLTAAEVLQAVDRVAPDLIIAGNLHSAGPDPWQLGILTRKYPTLAVLHDFWLLTGRCAYPSPCEKYLTGCDASCPTADEYPKLQPSKIAPAWRKKQSLLFAGNDLHLLANSSWTKNFACSTLAARGKGKASPPVELFRLAFPTDVFHPRDRNASRERLGLPRDRFILLVSGDLYDERKNMRLLVESLESLRLPNLTLVSLGVVHPGEEFRLDDVRRPGMITDQIELAHYYAAADIYVAPSQEETFGQVFIEAAACGTPAIGVRASGVTDAVVDGLTGILADDFRKESLAAAILELYRKPHLRAAMGAWARIYVENEWSMEAAYYHMYQSWQRLGLVSRLQLQPRIGFVPGPARLPDAIPIHRAEGITTHSHTLGPEEGPYAEYDLPRFRWAYGPQSRVEIHANVSGGHSLVLRYRNLFPEQEVRFSLNGKPFGVYSLAETGIHKDRLLCVPVALTAGTNELEMRFSRWTDPVVDGRPMAAVITELTFLPDECAAD